jgi:hypothetical protein
MNREKYRGYTLWGHAILSKEEKPTAREKYAGSGTITKDVSASFRAPSFCV